MPPKKTTTQAAEKPLAKATTKVAGVGDRK